MFIPLDVLTQLRVHSMSLLCQTQIGHGDLFFFCMLGHLRILFLIGALVQGVGEAGGDDGVVIFARMTDWPFGYFC